jgi:hypothetical protein
VQQFLYIVLDSWIKEPIFFGLILRSKQDGKVGATGRKRTSAAKAAIQTSIFGTAEAVPLSKTNFF